MLAHTALLCREVVGAEKLWHCDSAGGSPSLMAYLNKVTLSRAGGDIKLATVTGLKLREKLDLKILTWGQNEPDYGHSTTKIYTRLLLKTSFSSEIS